MQCNFERFAVRSPVAGRWRTPIEIGTRVYDDLVAAITPPSRCRTVAGSQVARRVATRPFLPQHDLTTLIVSHEVK
jgi:hypothetical protein